MVALSLRSLNFDDTLESLASHSGLAVCLSVTLKYTCIRAVVPVVGLVEGQGSYDLAGSVDDSVNRNHHAPTDTERLQDAEATEPSEADPEEELEEVIEETAEPEGPPGDVDDGLEDVLENDSTREELKTPESGGDEGDEEESSGIDAGAGSAVAGMVGWKVFTGGSTAAKNVIDRKSFKELAARQEKKRFKRWASMGL